MIVTPNPSKAAIRVYREIAPGIPDLTKFHDEEWAGEDFSNNPEFTPRTNIDSTAEPSLPLVGKSKPAGSLTIDAFNCNSHWFYIGNLLSKASNPQDLSGGLVWQTDFGNAETEFDFAGTFALRIWRDDGMAQWMYGCMVSEIALSFGAGKLTGAKVTIVPERGDYWDLATLTGTGTGRLYIRGIAPHNFPDGAFATDAAGNFYLKVTAASSTQITVKAKVGDATAYPVTTQVLARGAWNRVTDHNGARLGSVGVEVFVPAEVAGDFIVDDVIKFPRRRSTIWPLTLPSRFSVLNEVSSRILLPGVPLVVIKDGTLTITDPTEQVSGYGGQFPQYVRKRGVRGVKLAFNRESMDSVFRARLETGAVWSFVFDGASQSVIPTTNTPYALTVTGNNLVATGKTASVGSNTDYNDSISAEFFRSETESAVAVSIVNEIDDLTT